VPESVSVRKDVQHPSYPLAFITSEKPSASGVLDPPSVPKRLYCPPESKPSMPKDVMNPLAALLLAEIAEAFRDPEVEKQYESNRKMKRDEPNGVEA
jgi:hypothetical protein